LLDGVEGDQSALEQELYEMRRQYLKAIKPGTPDVTVPPRIGRQFVDGIEFVCRDIESDAYPLLLGKGREELFIEINKKVKSIAILGNVSLMGGYPTDLGHFDYVQSEGKQRKGEPASEYEFIFDDDAEYIYCAGSSRTSTTASPTPSLFFISSASNCKEYRPGALKVISPHTDIALL